MEISWIVFEQLQCDATFDGPIRCYRSGPGAATEGRLTVIIQQ